MPDSPSRFRWLSLALALGLAGCLAALASPARSAEPVRWEAAPQLADIPLDGAHDVTSDAVRDESLIELPFAVSLGHERYTAAIVGMGFVHLLGGLPPTGDAEILGPAAQPKLGPRIEVLGGHVRLATGGRVLALVQDDLVVIRWTALASSTSTGFATVELVLEPGAITAQYLHVPRGFTSGSANAADASARAFRLWDAPGDVTSPLDPPPIPLAAGAPPSGCDPASGTWCDLAGAQCSANAGQPGPNGVGSECADRVSNLWRFYEGDFCLGCRYRFYILVECGREMHLPTYDMESLDLEITNMVTGQKPDLHCINETAQGIGSSRSWRNPPNCPGKPGPWWAPSLDVTNNAGPGHVSFSDSTPSNGDCTTRYDVNCADLPTNGAAPTVNFGEEQTIDCSIGDVNGLCGIYRVDIISGGNGWELFANCDGTNTPQFDIYFDCTDAWDAYDPLPELAIANVAASGDCWTYAIQYDVVNIGCVDEPNDVPVRITSECGDVLDVIVPGPIPAHGSVRTTQPMTLSCPDGTITFSVDPDDVIPECTESGSAAACQAEEGVDTLTSQVICCPLVNAGADKVACAGSPVSLSDAGSQFADVFLWNDGGAGGIFAPSANVRNPTYTPPSPSPATITLTLRATVSDSSCTRTDALLLTVNPRPQPDAGAAQSACAGTSVSLTATAGIADQFEWSDGGAGGTFTPSAFVLSPTYRNTTPGTYTLTLTGTDVPTGCSGSDTTTATFFAAPVPDAGVDKQACACEPVPLPDATGGTATVFAWSDGGAGGSFLPSATAQNPTYMGAGPGVVTLTLSATDATTGCSATDHLTVELLDCPVADAGAPKQECVGDSATLFDADGGSATEYRWDDGGAGGTFTPSDTDLNASYANPTPGPHVLTLIATDRSADAPVLYQNDFEGAVGGEWSSTTTDVTPRGGRRFLGQFGNGDVTLTLTGLPAHQQLSVCFDLYVIRSWDGHVGAPPEVGPDLFDVQVVGGATLLHSSFAHDTPRQQSYPENYQDALGSGSPAHPFETGADETNTLGYPAAEGGDAVYRLSFTFRHTAGAVTLRFRGQGLEALTNESWGLDDLFVSSGSCRACTARDTVEVTVNTPPTVDAGAPKQACAGTPIALSDADPGVADDHRWNDGGAGGSFSPNSRVLHPSYTNPRAGSYTLTYTGRVTATGCQRSDTVAITVNPAPLVSAGADDTGCAGEAIPLDDAYASSGTTVHWSDGSAGGTFSPNADVLEPTYTNATAGTYTLTLTATRPSTGCTASDSSLVTVVALPSVNAGADKASCSGVAVSLSDSSSSASTVHWIDHGASGTFSPSADVLHPTYTNVAGTYTLTLRATGTAGCTREDDLTLTVNALPVVNAGADKEACINQDVALSDATSTADQFAWSDAGGGGTFTPSSTVRNPSYRNSGAGIRFLTLTSTNSATGCSSSDVVQVNVRVSPVAAFNGPASACEDTPVCFTNTSTSGVTWSWAFGDPAGGTSSQFEPCYIYSTPGTYTVTLTASNACGNNSVSHSVTVNPKPVASFTYTTQGNKFCRDKSIQFTDTSTNAPTSWSWDFGDGTTSTAQNPTHSYAIDGVFIVRLVACNACGCSPPTFQALEIAATCSTNCEANSNQINCTGTTAVVTGDTCTDHGNFNTTSYPCAPDISYTGENKIFDLNFPSGANFIIGIEETTPEPNGYDLDVMVSDSCNPPNCVAWGDQTVYYDDRTAANDDYWLIVDGRDGTCGPYRLTVQCLSPTETASCTAPVFNGIVSAQDADECGIPGILVTWDPVTDWGNGQSGPCTTGHFEIWRAPVTDPNDQTQVGTVPGFASSFMDLGTVPRRNYRYHVNAVNDCCAEPKVTTVTDDAMDDFGNAIDMDAGSGGTVTCDAPTVQLLGTASGGSGSGFDYHWTPTAGLSDPDVSNPVATIGATYTLTVTDRGDGCTAADSVVVVGDNVHPTVSAGPDKVITCRQPSVVLQGSATGGNASMGYLYQWSPTSGVSNPNIANPTTSTPGTYTLTVEANATGCTSTDTVVVTLSQDPPIANAGPNRELTCATSTVTLDGSASGGDASGGYAYSWSPASGVSDPTSATPTTGSAGTYILTATALATGCTDTDVVVVVSNAAAPTADAGPDRSIDCAAGPQFLLGSASGGDGSDGYGFAWSPAENVSDPGVETPTTMVPGTYTLTVTDVATGCTDTDTVVVSQDPNAPAANAGPDRAITCTTSSVTLTGSASGGDASQGYSYLWSPAAALSSATAQSPTTSTPGTYQLRVTSVADGCVGVDVVVVQDLTGPPTTSAGPDRVITCAAGSVTLQGSASGSDGRNGWAYAWAPAGQVSNPASATPTTSTPGTYTLAATDVFTGCTSTDTVTVTTDTVTPTADAGPDRTLTCSTTTVTLSGSGSGGNGTQGYAYAWSPAGSVASPTSASTTTTQPGTYTLTVTSVANGCTATDTVVVSQDVAPPTANAGSDRSLSCTAGSTVQLDGSASGGNGSAGYSFHWEPAALVTAPNSATTQATSSGTYTLTVTSNANGCTGTDTVVVTSTGAPIASAGPDDAITCTAASADLVGSASGGNGSQGYTYSWSPTTGVANPTAAVTTTTVPGTYTLQVTDVASGCRSFDTMIVANDTVPPTANAGPDGRVTCATVTYPLQGSATGGDASQGRTYAWTPTAGLSNPSIPNPTASIPGTYVLTVTDVASGCSATDSVVVLDGQVPPNVSAGADQQRTCAFPTATLSGSASGGDGSLGYAFSWTPATGLSDPASDTPQVTQAGTYTLTVTDVATGCTASDVAVVTNDLGTPTAEAGPGGRATCDAPLVQLNGSASGGDGSLGYDYAWSPAADVSNPISATPVALAPGTFTLTVTSRANGCTGTDTVVVTDGTVAPTASAGPDRAIDCDTASVVLQGSASGGDSSLGYAYAWEPSDEVSNPSIAAPTTSTPGLYSLTVTAIATGCASTDSVLVTQDTALPHANAGPDRRIDCDTPGATLSGSATGGNATQGYSFAWTPAAGVANPSAASTTTTTPGTYTLTVTTIATGCQDTDTVVVTQDASAPTASAGPDASLGCDGDPVTLTGSASGGNGSDGYSYAWTPAANVSSPTSAITQTTIAGTYTLTVTDLANGCIATDTAVVASDTATPSANAGADQRLDCDTSSVALQGSATGGDASAGYAYHWEPSALVSNAEVAQPTTSTTGTYTLTVTSIASGCQSSDVVIVTRDVRVPTANAGPDRALSCASPATTLQGSATGGNATQGYSYSWSPAGPLTNPNTATPTTSTPGTYTLTVTAIATGCSDIDLVVVTQDAATPVADAGPDAHLTCAVTSATLQGAASGGNGSAGYSYAWTPTAGLSDATVANPTVSAPGTYTLTVTDLANGCTRSDTVTVTQDVAAPTSNAGPDRVLDCTQPSVTLTGSGSGGNGSAGYSYHWEPAGAVTDASAAATGATASGTYTLTVTDLANGCTDDDVVVVTSSQAAPIVSAGPDGSITCADGVADLVGSASGGDGSQGYAFVWSPAVGVGNPTAAVTTTTVAGTYTLVVTDVATGCRSTDSVVIADRTGPPTVDAGPARTITCGTPSVTLQGSASGSGAGFTYSWTPTAGLSNPTSATPLATVPATYTLTATDSGTGCSGSDTVVVSSDFRTPVAAAGPDRSLGCAPSVTLQGSASGGAGTAGYGYAWTPAALVSNASIAQPTTSTVGTYTLTVTDLANGCTSTDTVSVVANGAAPVANAGPDLRLTCTSPSGTLQGSASGGAGTDGYAYEWSPDAGVADPNAAITQVSAPGTYTLTVTDLANGCTDTDTVLVTADLATPVADAGPDVQTDCAAHDAQLSGSATGGNGSLGFSYHWEPAGAVTSPDAAVTTATATGTFTLTVTDLANGCTDTDSVLVTSTQPPPIANAGADGTLRCDRDATLSGSASGGDGRLGYTAQWTPTTGVANPTSFVTTTSVAGTYTLTVTDVYTTCRGADSVVIADDAVRPVANAGPDSQLDCNTGVAALTGSASGGNGSLGYQFAWSPAAGVLDPNAASTSAIATGTFTLTVTDRATGCTDTDTVTVTATSSVIVAGAGADAVITCAVPVVTLNGTATGGGASGYTYRWEPAANVPDPNSATTTTSIAGTYTLTVTDVATGCRGSDTVAVTRDQRSPIANAGPSSEITCAQPVATLRGRATGGNGTAGYSYSWSPAALVNNPTAATTTTRTPGTYTLTVTDNANGCTGTAGVVITGNNPPPVVDAGPDQYLTCTVSIVVLRATVTGGDGSQGFTYSWNPPGGLSNPNVLQPSALSAGTYTLTVTDVATNCQVSDSVTVTTDRRAPVVDAGPNGTLTCTQSLAPLDGSATGGNGSLGFDVAWTPAAGVVDPTALVTQATAAGTFTLKVTDRFNGCSTTDTVTIVADPSLPRADAGPDRTISCAASSATLTGSASGGNGSAGYDFSWSPASDVANPTSAATTTSLPGTYVLTVTDRATDCRASDSVIVTSTTAPPATEPSALDLRPGATPLRVAKASACAAPCYALSWEDVGDAEYRVYVGFIPIAGSGYSHGRLLCGVATPSARVSAGTSFPMIYFLVTGASCDGTESSYGRDSFGVERPVTLLPCP